MLNYKGLKAVRERIIVPDAQVDRQIDAILKSQMKNVPVTGRPAQAGDEVVLDYAGETAEGYFEGGSADGQTLVLGSGMFIPGFEEQLIGAEIGKEVEVNVTFPEDYQAEDLKGKAAVFKCTVKEIKEKQLPELDDEFASEVSEFETLAEYKADVKGKLEERKAKEAKDAKEAAVIEEIVKDSEMEIPEAMLATQQRQMVDEFAQRIQMQGLSIDQYFQFTGSSYEQMIEQVKPQAEKRIQSRLVLEAVAKAENIEASQEDFDNEVKHIAEVYKMEEEKVRGIVPEAEVKKDLAVNKAIDFVKSNAEITTETVSEEKAA